MLINRPWHEVLRKPADEAGSGEQTGDGTSPAASNTTTPAPAEESGPDFSWLPEQYRGESGPDFDGFRTHYEDLQANLSALTEAQPQAPESPDGYDLTLPDEIDYGEITPPEWFEFDLDQDNPLVGELRNWMHEMKMPAEASKGLVAMLARYEAQRASQADAMAQQEMQSLGQGAQARIEKVQRAVETRVRNEAQRNALLQSLTTADAVRALEELIGGSANPKPPSSPPGSDAEGLTGFRRLQAARGG